MKRMGYRSDVRIVTSKKGYKVLDDYVKKYLRDHDKNRNWNLMKRPNIKKETPYTTYIGWDCLKWYEFSDYEDVNAIMTGLDYLKENGYSYRYSRLGENYDDYDEQYYESDNEDEQDLVYPSIIRAFDDDYILEELDREIKSSESEIEM
ncbi:MAG: hypothetical protein J6B98_04060 [Bacilli bacterium]|nr:hypothetical protein [Bacilli bacterium]